jgi:PAS domain-containing protein
MSVGDAVIATDAQGRVEIMNAVAENLTGWQEREALGKPVSEVFAIINETTRQPVMALCPFPWKLTSANMRGAAEVVGDGRQER